MNFQFSWIRQWGQYSRLSRVKYFPCKQEIFSSITKITFNSQAGVEEMAQWLRALTALPEDLSSVPSAHVECLTTAYNYSSRKSNASGFYRHLHSYVLAICTHTHACTPTYTCTHIHTPKRKPQYNVGPYKAIWNSKALCDVVYEDVKFSSSPCYRA
jgi:hypothetical protein